ncbi:MAG: FkbM family methyltransferase [Gammaproteobacteria bacterium]|nr:FkbM family methyltransferase [Gammaproteobacteria bacterium]
MTPREFPGQDIYQSPSQRIAWLLHLLKARFRNKERDRVAWLGRFIPANAVIFDIGAHFGYFAKEFARLQGGSCFIHAFEPFSYNHQILSSVTSRFPNVRRHDLALSDADGHADLAVPVKVQGKIGPGLAHLGEERSRDFILERVRTSRLDTVVTDLGIDRLDFVKCDVEGAEMLVFRGAEQVLRSFHPVIYTEINADYTKRLNYEPHELLSYLGRIGYEARHVDRDAAGFTLSREKGYTGPGDYLLRINPRSASTKPAA